MARCRGVFRYGLSLIARDQADAAAKLKIGPEPVEERRNAISDAQHEAYVHDAPQPPGRCAPQPEGAKIRHGGLASDCGETAEVSIPERRQGGPAINECPNLLGHVRAPPVWLQEPIQEQVGHSMRC
jgi:hypothetical protein